MLGPLPLRICHENGIKNVCSFVQLFLNYGLILFLLFVSLWKEQAKFYHDNLTVLQGIDDHLKCFTVLPIYWWYLVEEDVPLLEDIIHSSPCHRRILVNRVSKNLSQRAIRCLNGVTHTLILPSHKFKVKWIATSPIKSIAQNNACRLSSKTILCSSNKGKTCLRSQITNFDRQFYGKQHLLEFFIPKCTVREFSGTWILKNS